MLFALLGIIGLLLITGGVVFKKYQDYTFLAGGIFLLAYSISIQDWVFIVLQIIFVIAAAYEILS